MNKRKKRFDLNGNPIEESNLDETSSMNLIDMVPPVDAKPDHVSDYRSANPRVPSSAAYRRMDIPYPDQNTDRTRSRSGMALPNPPESKDDAPSLADTRDALDDLLTAALRADGTSDEIAEALTERIAAYLDARPDTSNLSELSDTETFTPPDAEIYSRVREMLKK